MRITSIFLFLGLALRTPVPVESYEWCNWFDTACGARNAAQATSDISNLVGATVGAVADTVSGVTNVVTDGVTNTIGDVCPICAGVAGAVGDSVKGVTKHVTDAVGGVASSVADSVGDVSRCVVQWDVDCAIGAVTESVQESTIEITGSVR